MCNLAALPTTNKFALVVGGVINRLGPKTTLQGVAGNWLAGIWESTAIFRTTLSIRAAAETPQAGFATHLRNLVGLPLCMADPQYLAWLLLANLWNQFVLPKQTWIAPQGLCLGGAGMVQGRGGRQPGRINGNRLAICCGPQTICLICKGGHGIAQTLSMGHDLPNSARQGLPWAPPI